MKIEDQETSKHISFECPRIESFPFVREVTMRMPAENIIEIHYPPEKVDQIRIVNVDDCIYRIDILPKGNTLCRVCLFPNVPWNNRDFMHNRFGKGVRKQSKNTVTIIYPTKQSWRNTQK